VDLEICKRLYNEIIEGIRNGMMNQYSEALTVGQALDGWRECKNSEWVSKTGERGENLVIFKCELTDKKYYSDNRVKNAQYALIFSSSVDGLKFKAESNALIFTFNDGKSYTYERDPLMDRMLHRAMDPSNSLTDNLRSIYENGKVFLEVSNTNGYYEKRE
jgi:hypothetical protein